MLLSCYFYIFFYLKNVHFFVSLYKELLKLTFSACLIVLGKLCEIFGYSVMVDFVSTIFGFSVFLGW